MMSSIDPVVAVSKVPDEYTRYFGSHYSIVGFFRALRVENVRTVWTHLSKEKDVNITTKLGEVKPRQPYSFAPPDSLYPPYLWCAILHARGRLGELPASIQKKSERLPKLDLEAANSNEEELLNAQKINQTLDELAKARPRKLTAAEIQSDIDSKLSLAFFALASYPKYLKYPFHHAGYGKNIANLKKHSIMPVLLLVTEIGTSNAENGEGHMALENLTCRGLIGEKQCTTHAKLIRDWLDSDDVCILATKLQELYSEVCFFQGAR